MLVGLRNRRNHMFNTFVFATIGNLFKSLWSTPVGQIFVITVTAYSICYMIYSGYLSWFYGGYGSSLLSQVGFTAIDFLGLVPATLILIIKLFWSLVKFIVKYLFFYILLPLTLFGIIIGFMVLFDFYIFPHNSLLTLVGFALWLVGLWMGISSHRESKYFYRISIAICFIGVLLMAISTPFPSNNPFVTNTSPDLIDQFFGLISKLCLEMASAMLLVLAVVYLFVIGSNLASLSVQDKMLSKVKKIVLNKDLQLIEEKQKQARKSSKAKSPELETYSYQTPDEKPIYLVGTFNKTTAFYFPSETTGNERGKLVVISNDLICLMEITGSKIISP
jgi:hypothetical protein